MFESWFSGGDAQEQQCDHRGMGKPRPGQWWPHNQETRAGYWEPRLLLLLVRRRQFANKSCQAEEEQVSCSCARAARS